MIQQGEEFCWAGGASPRTPITHRHTFHQPMHKLPSLWRDIIHQQNLNMSFPHLPIVRPTCAEGSGRFVVSMPPRATRRPDS